MKQGQYLLYDENCPLCVWYTNMFVKYGFLNPESRMSYQIANNDSELIFDRDRAKTEIALISPGQKPRYGVDSMLEVFANKWRVVKFLGKLFPIYILLQVLYRFISFNRKVIAPTVCQTECACTPKFNPYWRFVFIAFCGLLTFFFVGNFFNQELTDHLRSQEFTGEFYLFIGQLIFQSIFFILLKHKGLLTYLGHVAFISMIGALLLGSVHFVLEFASSFNINTELLAPIGLGVVLTLMVFEHMRRINLLGFSSWLTLSWVCYRIIIYPIVFIF